jgi:hypothetical protein
MSTRDKLIVEIQRAPEAVIQESYNYLMSLVTRNRLPSQADKPSRIPLPDFQARKRALFGDRVIADSQPIFDDLRADRF